MGRLCARCDSVAFFAVVYAVNYICPIIGDVNLIIPELFLLF